MLHLGLDIGGTKMEAVLLDQNGTVRFRERRPTYKADYAGFLHHLVGMVEYIKTEQKQEFTIGIGLPGAIDPETGLSKIVIAWC
jgi:fructokinase